MNIRARSSLLTLAAGTCALALLASACGSSGSSGSGGSSGGGTYDVSVVADLSGIYSTSVGIGAAGAKAYFDQLNAAGGVNGKQVKVTVLDAKSTANDGQAQLRAAITAKPVAIVQMSLSTGLVAAIPLLKGTKIPVFTTSAPDDLLVPTPNENLFMLAGTGSMRVDGALKQAQAQLGGLTGKKVAAIASSTPFCDGLLTALNKQTSALGATVSSVQRFDAGSASLDVQANQIVKSGPDAVLMCSSSTDTITAAKALSVAGLKAPIINPTAGGNDSPATFKAIGSSSYYAVRDVQLPQDAPELAAPAGPNGGVSYFTSGWLSGVVITDALKKCGANCDAAGLNSAIDALGSTDAGDLAYGPVQFSSTARAGLRSYQYYTLPAGAATPVKSGQPVTVNPS